MIKEINLRYKNINISISESVLRSIINYRQCSFKAEAGGMLIGSIVSSENSIELNDLTLPIERDMRLRYSFKRSDEHNKILYKKWNDSNYTKMYLGEWHTHPQKIPCPSFTDKASWNKLLKKSKTESPILFFLILGLKTLEFWVGDKKINVIEKCGSYNYTDDLN